ncbi:hypothetical protein TspCOW1_21710 [Thiohalobacter sp. COW1]|uniref:AAA family ATPase n=1 Tax=Thiohalobacter sp. COW1 TaxID=2795687 RepID=UPI0019161BDE|nr:AAA family ATPase [Thiohalobacter sp. COW1]BCO32068.1 hypothetical protein TspCOW1_21710 [Thiohalobacter sp. COW1]
MTEQHLITPPHSPEAESAVLGGLLLDNDRWPDVDWLAAEDFYDSRHRRVFRAMRELLAQGRPCEVVTVGDVLEQRNELDDVGGNLTFIGELARNTPAAANITAYADIVRDRARQRRMQQIGMRMQAGELPIESAMMELSEVRDERSGAEDMPELDLRSALETEPEPLDYVLPNFLAGTVGSIIAPGATGKSFLALELSATVATGQDITGIAGDGQTGRVVYMPAEDPGVIVQHRLHAIGAHIPPAKREQLYENLRIIPLAGRLPHLIDANGNINSDWISRLRRMAQNSRLLIIDTLRRFHGADENDGGLMALLIQLLEKIAAETGCAIIFIHHTNKAATLNGAGAQQQASRGSSVLTDNGRYQLNLTSMTEKEADERGVEPDCRRNFCLVTGAKVNYGEGQDEIWLRRAEGGVLLPAHFDLPGQVRAAKKKRLEVVREHDDDGGWDNGPLV